MKKKGAKKNFEEHIVLVKACRKCSGTELVSPSLGSYSPETLLIPGINELTGVKECVKCGHCGYPVEKRKKILVEKRPRQGFFARLGKKLFEKR